MDALIQDLRYAFRTLLASKGFAAFFRTESPGRHHQLQRRAEGRSARGGRLRLAAAGVALGLVGTFILGRLITSLLFGVTATDPWTFAIVSRLLVAVGLVASYFPARRAMRVDPLMALRSA